MIHDTSNGLGAVTRLATFICRVRHPCSHVSTMYTTRQCILFYYDDFDSVESFEFHITVRYVEGPRWIIVPPSHREYQSRVEKDPVTLAEKGVRTLSLHIIPEADIRLNPCR